MKKNYLLTIGLFSLFIYSTLCVNAHSTIYVDEIGRLHFLGKDPGAKAKYVQEMDNFDNPEKKDLTNIIYKNNQNSSNAEKNINATETDKMQNPLMKTYDASSTDFSKGSSKSSFTYTKGSMDASNPYNYGNTNIEQRGVNSSKTIYTDDLGRQHFFGKDNVTKD